MTAPLLVFCPTSALSSSDRLSWHRWGCHSVCTPRSVSARTKCTNVKGPLLFCENKCIFILCFYQNPQKMIQKRLAFQSGATCNDARTHSVNGVLVSSVKFQPACQLRVFVPLWGSQALLAVRWCWDFWGRDDILNEGAWYRMSRVL